ncbi:MAG: hypothetical protein AAF086_05040 [Planctomycetota bacterium]
MSTAGNTATLSKKERKQLRKQMMERKEQLLAKHGRPSGSSAGDRRLGSSSGGRMFSDIKPKLPADPPKPSASKLPTWTPPAQPEPHRTLSAATPKPAISGAAGRRRSLRPRVRDTVYTPAPTPTPAVVRDLDDTGPGPLTRFAAALENTSRRGLLAWRNRPWRDTGEQTRGDTHRTLSLMIKPLRTLGLVAVVGAVVLGRESRSMGASDTGSLVVLGMGLGLAIGLLALAEITSALRTIVRRL